MLGLPALSSATFAQTTIGAAQAQATFFIKNMTCALCPVTVKAAMSGVKGVRSVEINFAARTAHVSFDPALTNAAAIAQASEQAGYPAAKQG
jgi:mercuric ion binding protein